MKSFNLLSTCFHWGVRTILLPAATLLLLSACKEPSAPSTPPSAMPPPAPKVKMLTIVQETVKLTTELTGRTAAHLIAEIRPQVGGILQKRLFTEGAYVEAGRPLYQIDPATFQTAYESALASLEKSRANLVVARLKAKRYQELIKTKVLSQQEYDEANAVMKQAEATVAADEASVRQAKINLDRTLITSPVAGKIGRSSVTVGALVTANQTQALATVQQLDPIYVDLVQSNAEQLKLQKAIANNTLTSNDKAGNSKVQLLLEDGSPYPHPGTLAFSEITVDPKTGTTTLRSVFPNPDGTLLPGMYVRAIIETGSIDGAILVPPQAVSRDARGLPSVMTLDAKGLVQIKPLKSAELLNGRWLIHGELQKGDQIIIEGLQYVRPGAPAEVIPDTKNPSDK